MQNLKQISFGAVFPIIIESGIRYNWLLKFTESDSHMVECKIPF